ncbi:MAG: RecX family transcriptional regulator [Bryobacteraceae bacterium]
MRQIRPKLLDQAGLRELALKALSARAHSAAELRTKLRRRAAEPNDIDGVMASLKEYGYLNDKQFAETYAYGRLNSEGHGSGRVLRDLRRKQVAAPVAEAAVKDTFAGTDEVELIEKYLARKFRNVDLHKLLADPKKLTSVFGRLRYAGFASGPAIGVLKRYASGAGELEGLEEVEAPEDE